MISFIEESKTLFKAFDKLESLDVCTHCCVDAHYESLLRNSNRFDISEQAMYEYNSSAKAGYTLETVAELKYFTPRILELLLEEAEIHHSTEILLTRFSYAPPGAWTNEELDFFQRFALAYWKKIIAKEKLPYHEDPLAILIMLSKLPINLFEIFAAWLNEETVCALMQFANFYLYEFNWTRHKLNNPFAEKEFGDTVISFFTNPQTTQRIIQQIENLFWIKELDLTEEQDYMLNSLYIILKNS